jgi:hypothetical protein
MLIMQQSKIAFLTEMGFEGRVPANHSNMRTEFAWMHALDADHRHLHHYTEIQGYDHVFIIFPKGKTFLSAEGSKLINGENPVSGLLASSFIHTLKQNNKKVYYVQEGPHWWWNDYEIIDQINFYNMLAEVDTIFAHNYEDQKYYIGLFPNKVITTIPTLMIEDSIKDIECKSEEKAIIGGNFARWYGGFESYIVAQEFQVPIWGQTSHAMRDNESHLIQHLPRVMWTDWIKQLSTFKYAVHLMPTVAAGTFALNCAYLGIPCIGNNKVDTQKICHPMLSVDVEDINTDRQLATQLKKDKSFYEECSRVAKAGYEVAYSLDGWKDNIKRKLDTLG